MYDYGDAAGCRWSGTTATAGNCNNGWRQSDVYHVGWGAPPAYAVPEIYATNGVNAQQWQQAQQAEPDWQKLYDADPLEYVRQKDIWRDRQDKIAAAQSENARLQSLQAAEQQKQMMADPEANAVLQASLAETQRRAMRDQTDLKMSQDKMQVDIAMNTENNLTKERMKEADLTVDEARLRTEQQRTAEKLQQETQRNLGD